MSAPRERPEQPGPAGDVTPGNAPADDRARLRRQADDEVRPAPADPADPPAEPGEPLNPA